MITFTICHQLDTFRKCDNSMTIDCNIKRAIFISKILSLNQEFYLYSSHYILKLYNIYCFSLYGSSIWDLSSQCVSKLYTALYIVYM